ncbi:amino acid ABC transporter permease [Leucobacter sp. UT-8R-CII-1-4]|uniref:amino acid ABC transporter permease n=1 Tax=Leucobacter sp. UT-8R-CII-1-4 TaxID=3040075 RepID=UPI0024A7B6E4|nr:amino acid ABC transporter permease [Leucobacter sp. UT-8R-CII-1-4]MDI6022602.1 amino acid ABC transporter permease [Leucobacter sp. UT-8R-CII-1-4]
MSDLSALYETPGPLGRRRNRIVSAVVWVGLAAVIAYVVYRFQVTGQLAPEKWTPFLYGDIQRVLLEGLLNTLKSALVGAFFALVIGVVFALMRLSHKRWIRTIAVVCIEFFRGLPVLLIMFAIFMIFDVSAFVAVAGGLALFNGMVLAEVIRAGINAVPRGQREAGLSIGLSSFRTMWFILLPQAFRTMLPTIVSQVIVLLKDSALGYIVSFHELVYAINQVGRAYHNLLPTFIVGAAIFIVINLAVNAFAVWLERRLARGRR